MAKIVRDPASAAKETYDLIIIGGGIYGVMLSLAASRRNLRSLLIERNDFGGATSFNSLRVIHGGLRYLQTLDLSRFRESVGERRWFLQMFPKLVQPLPCLMPLYGEGLRRPFILRFALAVNDIFSRKRNEGVPPDNHLPQGLIIGSQQTRELFPDVDTDDLKGGAVWYDAWMPDSQRLLIQILRWACEYGATALNYVESTQLLTNEGRVAGVVAVDRETDTHYEYKAKAVVNACGPWCRNLATSFHQDEPSLFRGSLAWNVLLNKKAFSNHTVAVAPKKPGGKVYFLMPWKGKLLAGTGHAPWSDCRKEPMPSTAQLHDFLSDLNSAVPTLEVSQQDILRIFAGLLPVTEPGGTKLSVREVIIDHASNGGPRGFFSVSGVKFTTARLVAEKVLNRIFPDRKTFSYANQHGFRPPESGQNGHGIFDFERQPTDDGSTFQDALRLLIAEESVQHLDDLIFRRTNLWENPAKALEIAQVACGLFKWDDSCCRNEMKRLKKQLMVGRYQHRKNAEFGSVS